MKASTEAGVTTNAPASRATAWRRVTHGSIANLLNQVITMGGQIVLVPLFLSYWGNQVYGEWLTLSATVAYITLLDLGLQTYVVNRMNQCRTQGSQDTFNEILQSALLFTLITVGIGALLLLPLPWIVPVKRWFHVIATGDRTIRLVSVLLIAQFLSFVPIGVLTGIYRAIGEYARGANITNVQRSGGFVLSALTLVLGGSMIAMASIQFLVPVIVGGTYILYDLARRHPEIRIGFDRARLGLALSFLAPSWLFLLIQMSSTLVVQGSVLLAGALFGAVAVPAFVSLRTLTNVIRQGAGIIYNAIWPEMTRLEAQERYDLLGRIHILLAKVLTWITGCAALFLYFFGAEIVAVWTRHRIVFDANLNLAFLLLIASQAWWMASSLVLISSNNHRLVATCQTISGISGLLLGWLLARWFGPAGIIYGLFACDAIVCGFWIPRAACRMIRQQLAVFLSDVLLRGIPVFVLMYGLTAGFLSLYSGAAILRWIVCAAILSLGGAALAFWVWMSAEERSWVLSFQSRRGWAAAA